MLNFSDIQRELEESSFSRLLYELDTYVKIPDSISLETFDCFLSILHPIISVAVQLDFKNQDYWATLEYQIPELRKFLRSRFIDARAWDCPIIKQKILVGDHTNYTSLIAPMPQEAGNRLLPLKALLLVGIYIDHNAFYSFKTDRHIFGLGALINLADVLRKCSDPCWNKFHILLEHVPDWPGEGPEIWKETLHGRISKLPRSLQTLRYPGRHDYLFCLSDIIAYIRPKLDDKKISRNVDESIAPHSQDEILTVDVVTHVSPDEPQFSPSTGRKIGTSPSLHIFRRRQPNTENNTEATAPEISIAYPQEGVTSYEPSKVQAVQAMEVRYYNFRTAMENQRLPWTWDCLNPLEVLSLVTSLSASSVSTDNDSCKSRLLVWLILLTGQHLSEILKFVLNGQTTSTQANALIQGKYWQRRIPSPHQAYVPKSHQSSCLFSHAETVTFELPECVKNLTANLRLQEIDSALRYQITLGNFLHLDPESSEHMVRKYLEVLRGRDYRFLLGRLRRVLSKEVMYVTQSPVLTHLITSLPADAPPTGVYYSAFPIARLQAAYNQAVQRIVKGLV